MKATELRIGNYIQATNEITICRGNGIDEDIEVLIPLRVRGVDEDSQLIDGSCAFSLEEIETTYELEKYNNLEPIPLTEDWLSKFGFETKNKKIGWYKKEGFMFTTRLSGNNLSIQFIKDGLHVKIVTVKNVHSLQNLYYSLTKKEL